MQARNTGDATARIRLNIGLTAHRDVIDSEVPRLRREVFVRVRLHGQSHRQVCDELQLSAKAVELHIGRAVFDLSELSQACRHV